MTIKLLNESFEMVPASRLKLHPRNVNRGDTEAIRESIRANGFFGALVVQKSTGYILVGNHRFDCGVEEGMTDFPVHWIDVSDIDAVKIMLVDNKTSRDGEDDEEALAALLQEINETPAGLEGSGYGDADLQKLLADAAVPDFSPVGEGDQGKLDERSKVKCPKCGHEFTPS